MKAKILLLVLSLQVIMTFLYPAFSSAQGIWTKKADLPADTRWLTASFSIGSKGYFGIGISEGDATLRDFWEWDQATNIWTKKADYPGNSEYDFVSFSIGTKGYIGTGSAVTGGGNTNDFWEYDPATNAWTKKASLPVVAARSWAAGFSIGGKGYIGTGVTASDVPLIDFWEWDQANNVWTQKADFGGGFRAAATGFSIGNKGYIVNGIGVGDTFPNDFWEWDQATNVWTRKADFAGTARALTEGFSIGNKGYVGIGLSSNVSTLLKDFWEWNQATNVWSQKADFGGTARCDGGSFSIGDKGYFGTGFSAAGTTNDLWEYDPSVVTAIEKLAPSNISFYPNPTSGKFTIKNIEPQTTNSRLEVFNISGEMIYSNADFQPTTNEIDLSTAPRGIYFVNIYNGEKLYKGKIIIH